MTQKTIETTLNHRLHEYLQQYPIDVAYNGVEYTPREGVSYLQIDPLHGEANQITLGSDSCDRAVGVYQITINIPGGRGTSEETKILSQLKEFFKRGTKILHEGNSVTITQFYLGSFFDDPDYFRRILNVVFRSDLTN